MQLALLGPGNVGSKVLQLLNQQRCWLRQRYGVRLRVVLIANSGKMLRDSEGIGLQNWSAGISASTEITNLEKVTDTLAAQGSGGSQLNVIIDTTASTKPAAHYDRWLVQGINIVTANKQHASGDIHRYERAQALTAIGTVRYHYETTAGAGLPLLQTLEQLSSSGDQLI